ncbi:hypothetical protein AU210_015831 [Fusarium oxysporum f. sp. radicis-cucumerinum]|uniref:Transposase IS30-like HTH domain-containing protein n=1 Tax=Fusarium oxysporum f. sp. radicis-cucumerinum TaxID=327505 RepID=A0A2H3GAD6_FUSOX|nr:hypothetical protein AU210_015831 [Fusarium oxysporum f. sp. radicis-cucumerinum]
MCARRGRNQDFSDVARALIVQAVEGGRSYRDVATEAGCSPATIFNIYQRWKTHRTLDKKPKSGRPRKLTVQQIRWRDLTTNNTQSYQIPLRSQIEGYAADTAI